MNIDILALSLFLFKINYNCHKNLQNVSKLMYLQVYYYNTGMPNVLNISIECIITYVSMQEKLKRVHVPVF